MNYTICKLYFNRAALKRSQGKLLTPTVLHANSPRSKKALPHSRSALRNLKLCLAAISREGNPSSPGQVAFCRKSEGNLPGPRGKLCPGVQPCRLKDVKDVPSLPWGALHSAPSAPSPLWFAPRIVRRPSLREVV